MAGFFSSEETLTPEGIERRRRMADMLLQESQSTAPIQSPWQGAARIAQALAGGYRNSRLDEAEKSNQTYSASALAKFLGGDKEAPSASPAPSQASVSPPAPSQAMTTADATPRPGGGAPASVPPQFASMIDAASAKTGVPSQVLAAKIMQESGFRPDATGKAGEVGLTQIMPSTARDPGFGVKGVDPTSLRDPAANIDFGAQYLAARGKAAGVQNWNDPQQVAKALTAYNGGGDPNYARNVMRYMPGQQAISDAVPAAQVAQAGGGAPAPQAIARALAQPSPDMPAPGAAPAQGVAQPPAPQSNKTAALAAFLSDPRVSKDQKALGLQIFQMQQKDEGFTTVDLGASIGVMDKRGNVVRQIPKQKDAEFGVIGQDDMTGSNRYGFINKGNGTVQPVPGQAVAGNGQPAAPGGLQMPPPPPGTNPRIWRDEQTREAVRGGPKFTEGETNAAGFASKMEEANAILEATQGEGTRWGNRAAASIPIIGNAMVSEGAQKYEQAKRTFINSQLRKESGAAIGAEEFASADKQYFPQPGDSDAVIKQKREARKIALESMKGAAGKAFKPPAVPTPKVDSPAEDGWQEIDGVRIRRIN